jgi:hypothetical protein
MKMKLLLPFCCLACLLLFGPACSTPKTAAAPTPGVSPSATDAYSVTVLNADLPSPRKEMKGMIGPAAVTVNYGSPSVKGRQLAGGLIPYGEVWRAGANEATTLEVSTPVTFGGQSLPAGKYALFVRAKEGGAWDVIVNEVANQWGAYNYDADKDVITVSATPTMVAETSETMEYQIDGKNLVLRWGKIRLPIAIGA